MNENVVYLNNLFKTTGNTINNIERKNMSYQISQYFPNEILRKIFKYSDILILLLCKNTEKLCSSLSRTLKTTKKNPHRIEYTNHNITEYVIYFEKYLSKFTYLKALHLHNVWDSHINNDIFKDISFENLINIKYFNMTEFDITIKQINQMKKIKYLGCNNNFITNEINLINLKYIIGCKGISKNYNRFDKIKYLNMSPMYINDGVVNIINKFNNLKYLSQHNFYGGFCYDLHNLKNLVYLSMEGNIGDNVLQNLINLRYLYILKEDFTITKISDISIQKLVNLEVLCTLLPVKLYITDKSISKLTNLRMLHLTDPYCVFNFATFDNLKNIEHIYLPNMYKYDEDKIENITNLQYIELCEKKYIRYKNQNGLLVEPKNIENKFSYDYFDGLWIDFYDKFDRKYNKKYLNYNVVSGNYTSKKYKPKYLFHPNDRISNPRYENFTGSKIKK